MSPIDIGRAIEVSTEAELDAWLADHGTAAADLVVAIHNRASGHQTVTPRRAAGGRAVPRVGRHQTKHIDEARYAIRFVPRRPRSHWSEKNRAMARRLWTPGG